MPRSKSIDGEQFDRAVSELEYPILKELAARPLSPVELAAQYPKKSFRIGWQFEGEIGGRPTILNLLLPFDFPYAPPSFGLVPAPKILTYPHVEEDGTLCLLSAGASVDSAQPAEVVRELLSDAVELLEKSYTGENRGDFRDEFLSYWSRASTQPANHFLSLLRPSPPSRIVRAWPGIKGYTFAENEESLKGWLANLGDKKEFQTFPAGLIWLTKPMLPEQYPNSNADVLSVATELGDDVALKVLRSLAAAAEDKFVLLIGSRAVTGACFAGATLNKPRGSSSPFSKQGSLLTKGFRPGSVPREILASRFLNATEPVTRHEVDRADPAWIHGRDIDNGQIQLSAKRVVVLGCGSIGSLVAKTLATVGVGQITFVDPENLVWANIGRHFLGAEFVGGSKAKGLAKELQPNYPHIEFDHRSAKWEMIADTEPGVLSDADLIVSSIGNFSSEGLLNRWQRLAVHPPVVYGWTEAFASAGHAVAIFNVGACFRCQTTEHGEPTLKVTEWPGPTLKQEPACGIMFQPYGPIELNNSANLIAELSVDVLLGAVNSPTERIWASRESVVTSNGGAWSRGWLELTAGDTRGGFCVERAWGENSECTVCRMAIGKC
jgi:sulfur-carrier protein adenylyltransferase/sulfurtransferase